VTQEGTYLLLFIRVMLFFIDVAAASIPADPMVLFFFERVELLISDDTRCAGVMVGD